nr:hypothetical protein [Tanacetum cinerariifolium]
CKNVAPFHECRFKIQFHKNLQPVVKGMRKYFPKAEDEKDKQRKKKKDVGNEMTREIEDLKALCQTAIYHKVVTAVDPTMKNENHSKVCGSGGLLLQAPEVQDWDITNP